MSDGCLLPSLLPPATCLPRPPLGPPEVRAVRRGLRREQRPLLHEGHRCGAASRVMLGWRHASRTLATSLTPHAVCRRLLLEAVRTEREHDDDDDDDRLPTTMPQPTPAPTTTPVPTEPPVGGERSSA